MSGAQPRAEASRRPKGAAGAILSAPAQSSPAPQAQILAPQAAADVETPARRQAGAGHSAGESAPAAGNFGTTPEQFLSPAGNAGPAAEQGGPAQRPGRTAQKSAPAGGALPCPAGGDDGALPPPFWATEPETEKPPLPTEPPPERRPDYGRARREALSLLLRSELTGLAVDPTRLEVGVPVVFDTIGSYCAKTGLPRARLLGQLGALADGCTLRLAGVTLVLTDFHGAGDCRRRRFTQAHELGHILLGHTRDGPAEEQEANRFAGELLMPAPVLAALGSRGGRLRAREIAEWFFVSVSAASAQLARLQRDGVVWDADARALVRRCDDWIEAALTDPPVTV